MDRNPDYATSPTNCYRLLHDGQLVLQGTEIQCVSHALRYEGYVIEPLVLKDLQKHIIFECGENLYAGHPRYWRKTGEKRPPKQGEFYLSGARPLAYQAPNDLTENFHIMIPVPDPPTFIDVNGFRYRLYRPTP